MEKFSFLLLTVTTAMLLALNVAAQNVAAPLRSLLDQAPSDCCSKLAAFGFTSTLPVVVIDSSARQIPYHEDTNITLCTCSKFKDYSGIAQAAIRGTSSANFTKKSFKVTTLNATDGKGLKFPFLGMPEDDDWILYGPELDATLGMRNYITYNLARASGRYATRTVYCEVFLVEDGAPLGPQHYNGVYIAEEKVKRSKDRVNIAKQSSTDPADSGYIILFDNDNLKAGDVTFGPLTGWENPFQLKDPGSFIDGGAWLLKYLESFQAALASPDWLQQYPKFVDRDAFIDFFLLVELSKNPDGYRGSTYLYKDAGNSPLVAGPAWDYNEAYGTCCGYPIEGWQNGGASGPGVSGGSAISVEGWRFNICDDPERCTVEPGDGTSRWYRRMWQDKAGFRKSAAARWETLRSGPWSDAAVGQLLDGAVATLSEAAVRNYEKYSSSGVNWRGEVEKLRDWVLKHMAWIDTAIAEAAAA